MLRGAGAGFGPRFFFPFFFFPAPDGYGVGRKYALEIFQRELRNDRHLCEHMLGKNERELHAPQDDFRNDSRDKNPRQQARKNHKKKIVPGVQSRQDDDSNDAEIEDSLTSEAVINLQRPAFEHRAACKRRDDLEGDESRECEREDRHPPGHSRPSLQAQGCGAQRGEKGTRKGKQGQKKSPPRRAVNVSDRLPERSPHSGFSIPADISTSIHHASIITDDGRVPGRPRTTSWLEDCRMNSPRAAREASRGFPGEALPTGSSFSL